MKEQDEPDVAESESFASLKYLLIGGAIGALLGLMFAPKSGSELRSDIADATRKGINRSREVAGFGRALPGDYYTGGRRGYFRYRWNDSRTQAAGAQGSLPGSSDFEEPAGQEQDD